VLTKVTHDKSIEAAMKQYAEKLGRDDFSAIDLACGSGICTRKWRKFTKGEIIGSDITQDIMDLGANIEKEEKQNISYIQQDMLVDLKPELKDKKFDVATAAWLFCYSPTKTGLFKMAANARAVLKDGGCLIALQDNPEWISPKRAGLLKRWGYDEFPLLDKDKNKEKYDDEDPIGFQVWDQKDKEKIILDTRVYYYSGETIKKAFYEAGFKTVEFEHNKFDDDELNNDKEYWGASAMLIKAYL
jgi:ubiquinone/menaquinone biosynthesis C-methylase UbiE